MKTMHGLLADSLRAPNKMIGSCFMPRPSPLLPARAQKNRPRPFGGEKVHWTFSCFRLTSRRRGVLSPSPCGTTAWMHDSRDGGGRAASGTAAEEVEQSREHLPRRVGMRARTKAIGALILIDALSRLLKNPVRPEPFELAQDRRSAAKSKGYFDSHLIFNVSTSRQNPPLRSTRTVVGVFQQPVRVRK